MGDRRSTPAAPKGAGPAGRRLWSAVMKNLELDEHERALLVEAVRTLDLLEVLDVRWRDEGAIVDTPQGPRAHPAAVEARQQRIVYARLVAQLRLPTGLAEGEKASGGEPDKRPQRRGSARGVYGIRGVVSS
jgi:hypothetical protein